MHNSKYIVYAADGSTICVLNEALIKQQHITEMGLVSIKILHRERHSYVQKMRATPVEDRVVLRWFAQKITEADYELQKLWHFPVDEDYHRWWEVPHCTCPHLDAQERYGTPYRVINGQCPVHGTEHETNTPV